MQTQVDSAKQKQKIRRQIEKQLSSEKETAIVESKAASPSSQAFTPTPPTKTIKKKPTKKPKKGK